jgi:anhydro-N-acetylmuramic acid kinase
MSQQYYIGLMSGTSADAIDGVIICIDQHQISLVKTLTLPIPEAIKSMIFCLAISGENEIEKIRYLDYELAQLFSTISLKLCQESNISTNHIRAIGSHGQTIRHYPPDHKSPAQQQYPACNESFNTDASKQGYTLQIGDPNIIVQQTGITTVTDFRRRDIAAGGHGAPLAPAFHSAFFASAKQNRIILNTGGIANITYLPASNHPTNNEVIGFDTGPANGLMDAWCQLHLQQHYDESGQWAASGAIDQELLKALLKHPYFALPPPKSTGRETFNISWVNRVLATQNRVISAEDVQATLTELTVETITTEINKIDSNADVYICGGGAHNSYFCERLRHHLSNNKLSSTEVLGIHPDWVEAAAFAWLAKRAIDKLPGNLPSVTGAREEVISGGIYWA